MKNAILVLAAISMLILAGCASTGTYGVQPSPPPQRIVNAPSGNATVPPQQPPAPSPEKNATLPPSPPELPTTPPRENSTPAPQPPAPPVVNATPASENQTPAMSPDSCIVEFQKDASNAYVVMVKTSSAKTLSVKCPNGQMAVQQGGFFICENLAVPAPATAYLDGKTCGSAQFNVAPYQTAGGNKQSCQIGLAPSRITAGTTTSITVRSYSPSQSKLTYLCGPAEVSESTAGLYDTGKICRFDTPGTIEVYAELDGAVCATALLQVFATSRECSTYNSTLEKIGSTYIYRASVAGRGYNGIDEMKYSCYGISTTTAVSQFPSSTDFTTTIECRGSTPLTAPVDVRIGNDYCGSLQPPSQ